MQYSNVWDCVKIGRCNGIHERRRAIGKGHNFELQLIASYQGQGHLERRVHKHLEDFRSSNGLGAEWFNAPGVYALSAVAEVIKQSHQESLPAPLESER